METPTSTTTAPFSKKSTKPDQINNAEQKQLRNKAFAHNHWLKPLLESVRLVHNKDPNPPPAFFLHEIEKVKAENSENERLCHIQPDLFIRVKPNKDTNGVGYCGFLTHSLVWSIGPALLESINEQRDQDYFRIDASTSKEDFTETHVGGLIRFLYSGELEFDESEKDTMTLMANDFGIEAFCIAVTRVKDGAEEDNNNPFTEKTEGVKKIRQKHRIDGQKGVKSKSVGKNKGVGNKMKENLKDFKAVMEFMKMMKD